MYQLDILTKIPEQVPDGIIRIRPGESAIMRIDGSDFVPDIRGRPEEWKEKTIPALVIAISDDLPEVFRVFRVPEDPEDAVPFIAISSDRDALLACRAEGKILSRKTPDCSSDLSEPMQYLHEIIAKTEYCIILCSRTIPDRIFLAGEIAKFARDQNTLAILALIESGELDSNETVSVNLDKFQTIILNPENPLCVSPVSLEQIRDLCEATIDDIVASGGRHALMPADRFVVRELLFNGGICFSGGQTERKADVYEIIRAYIQSVLVKKRRMVGGTYSILKVPWDSTTDDATCIRNSLLEILDKNLQSIYPHQLRVEGYYPETKGTCDLIVWTFSAPTLPHEFGWDAPKEPRKIPGSD